MEQQGKSSRMLMANLVPFQFEQTSISVIMDDHHNPWWIASEVCALLGIDNVSKACARLDEDEKQLISMQDVGNSSDAFHSELKMLILNEPGLYGLILGSRKKAAREFKRWVKHEVLPQIRKTGQYSAAQLPSLPLPSPAETLETLGACKAALENLGCFDDRDTITFAAYVRCVAATAMQPLLPPGTPAEPSALDTTQPVLWTMSMRLQYLRYPVLAGADGDSKRIRIGSLAKKAYQAEYGEVPKKMWDYVRGQQRQVNAYQPERLHVLDHAIETILGAPRLQVVTPL